MRGAFLVGVLAAGVLLGGAPLSAVAPLGAAQAAPVAMWVAEDDPRAAKPAAKRSSRKGRGSRTSARAKAAPGATATNDGTPRAGPAAAIPLPRPAPERAAATARLGAGMPIPPRAPHSPGAPIPAPEPARGSALASDDPQKRAAATAWPSAAPHMSLFAFVPARSLKTVTSTGTPIHAAAAVAKTSELEIARPNAEAYVQTALVTSPGEPDAALLAAAPAIPVASRLGAAAPDMPKPAVGRLAPEQPLPRPRPEEVRLPPPLLPLAEGAGLPPPLLPEMPAAPADSFSPPTQATSTETARPGAVDANDVASHPDGLDRTALLTPPPQSTPADPVSGNAEPQTDAQPQMDPAEPAASEPAVSEPEPTELRSRGEVPDVVRQMVESLPDCDPRASGITRRPFGTRFLFAFPCAAASASPQQVFVLARSEDGDGANVLMFPLPRGGPVPYMHELSNARVSTASREFMHSSVDPTQKPCRTEGRWRIDDRGNAGLVAWRAASGCSADLAAAAPAKVEKAVKAKPAKKAVRKKVRRGRYARKK